MTPEGKVKAKVKAFLKQWDVWTDWPVPGGFGKSTLDCLVIRNGRALWIETKAPGQVLTDRQEQLRATLVRHGCRVLVIDTCDLKAPEYNAIAGWMDWAADIWIPDEDAID